MKESSGVDEVGGMTAARVGGKCPLFIANGQGCRPLGIWVAHMAPFGIAIQPSMCSAASGLCMNIFSVSGVVSLNLRQAIRRMAEAPPFRKQEDLSQRWS
ncbi:hypothetical protein Pst134EA_025492 [Puccinia striiformis f. sp. tritici]|uniref:hypothetical protein n=1 Tax=Puccinia striiformis f. sp. tritici TaxID=168172 RepID=UPI002007967C|nr:hypothetical protein Pst134EA_025492 [Puccinia striiformis f. sp. tritici]KAH9451542.1 hypothetical protein Pst134EA_025492 [Puccinia striiformis f. sp. tritici]